MQKLLDVGKTLLALALREWQIIRVDKKLRTLLLLAPLLNTLLVTGVYAPSYVEDLPIAVVQRDDSALAQKLVRWLDQHQRIAVVQRLKDLTAAETLFAEGKIVGYVVLEDGLGSRIKQNEEARILLYTDATNLVVTNTIASAVQGVTQTLSVGIAMQKAKRLGAFKQQAQSLVSPLRAEVRPLGNPSLSYADFMLPGMVLTVLQQVILLCLAFAWAGEEENRTWKQVQGISQSPMMIVIGKNIPYAVISMLWLLVFAYLLLPWSHVTDQIQLSSLLGFSLVFVAVMVSWGTWISVLIKDRLSATQALMFLSVPSFILSGYTWPFESLPVILQGLSFLLPLTHLATMFRGLYVTGADLSMYPDQLMTLLVFIAGHGGLALWSVKRQLAVSNRQSVSQ